MKSPPLCTLHKSCAFLASTTNCTNCLNVDHVGEIPIYPAYIHLPGQTPIFFFTCRLLDTISYCKYFSRVATSHKFLVFWDRHFSNISLESINFMDLTISVQNNTILAKTYRKSVDCDSYIYILNTSCHLLRWLANVPRGQFTSRNCCRLEDCCAPNTKDPQILLVSYFAHKTLGIASKQLGFGQFVSF